MKIGLFGGTFNPIHLGHLKIAEQVGSRLELDRILFIPTGDPPHKPATGLASAHHRLEMVRLAIRSYPAFAASDIEVRRAGKSYSIDTIRALQEQFGPQAELFFIVGLDAFVDVPTWKESAELLRYCHFVVVGRPGWRFHSLAGLDWLPPLPPDRLAPLDRNEGQLDVRGPAGTCVILLHLAPCEISASEVRARARRGEALRDWLPAPVESYIMHARLYQEGADPTGG